MTVAQSNADPSYILESAPFTRGLENGKVSFKANGNIDFFEIGNGMTAGEGLLIAGAWGSAGEDSLGYYQEGLGFLIRGNERLDPEQCANVVVAYGLLRTGIVD